MGSGVVGRVVKRTTGKKKGLNMERKRKMMKRRVAMRKKKKKKKRKKTREP